MERQLNGGVQVENSKGLLSAPVNLVELEFVHGRRLPAEAAE